VTTGVDVMIVIFGAKNQFLSFLAVISVKMPIFSPVFLAKNTTTGHGKFRFVFLEN
jgi:hypothetical protein